MPPVGIPPGPAGLPALPEKLRTRISARIRAQLSRTRPADSALPLPCSPNQQGCHYAAEQRNFLSHFNHPVYRATDTAPIFAGTQEQCISEVGDPSCKEQQEEGVLAATLAQGEVLRAERCFQNQEIQINLRWR